MSKYLIVKYRDSASSDTELDLREILLNIAPANIDNKVFSVKSKLTTNLFIGILNPINEFIEEGKITIGQTLLNKAFPEKECLPDGSYAELQYNDNEISFYCDRFESKTLWYYFDSEKLIISNSQRAIISLKKSFSLNKKAVSWFLSSGSLGYKNAWDAQIQKVTSNIKFAFDCLSWKLNWVETAYDTQDFSFKTEKEFDDLYLSLTKSNFLKGVAKSPITSVFLPLSGGNDSRLLHAIAVNDEALNKIQSINWGVAEKNKFNDKVAAIKIAKYHKTEIIDATLPNRIYNIEIFFETYIKNSDCRIDHFNAYSDCFEIFENAFTNNIQIMVRGDIPFTEGLDLNNQMSRFHIGIPTFKDYSNYSQYDLNSWVSIQENDSVDIGRKTGESLIEWRDRLYIDYRIPTIISAFNDIVNGYIESRSPMMTYSHFLLYSKQKDKQKGNKNHIVRLSKKMDQSKVPFDAAPSIPSINELFYSSENIEYLIDYLDKIDNQIFSSNLLSQIKNELLLFRIDDNNETTLPLKSIVKNFLAERLPSYIKAHLKSQINRSLNPLTLAYRIVLIDKVNKIFIADAKQ
jgi:hypothetical protein